MKELDSKNSDMDEKVLKVSRAEQKIFDPTIDKPPDAEAILPDVAQSTHNKIPYLCSPTTTTRVVPRQLNDAVPVEHTDASLPENRSPAGSSLERGNFPSDLSSSLAMVSLAPACFSENDSIGDTSPKGVDEEIYSTCQTNVLLDSIHSSAVNSGAVLSQSVMATSSVLGDSLGDINCALQTLQDEVASPMSSHEQKILELEAQVQLLREAENLLRLQLKEAKDEIQRLRVAGEDHEFHDLLVCEKEKHLAKPLSDEIRGKTLIRMVQAVGWIDYLGTDVEKEQSTASKLLKLVLLGMIDVVFRLHRKGFCLKGKFSLKDFYWVNKKIKLSGTMKSKICPRSVEDIRINFAALNKIIRKKLFAGLKLAIPVDIEYLLTLMAEGDAYRDQALIRYNCSLMDNLSKRAHFFTLWDRFLQIEKQDKNMHGKDESLYRSNDVLRYITAAKGDWKFKINANEYLKEIDNYHYRKVDASKSTQRGVRFLLEFVRHSLHHFVDHSVHRDGTIIFCDKDMYPIVESCYPGLLCQFQAGIHSIGELEEPHLDNTMKV